MHNFCIPLAFVHHDTKKNLQSQFLISIKKYKFEKLIDFDCTAQSIFHVDQITAQTELTFCFRGSKIPYAIEITMEADKDLHCILYHPVLNISFKNTCYDDGSLDNVPVRIISQKINGKENSKPIDGLRAEYNYRSWVNPWLKNGDQLKFRIHGDLRHVHSQNKNLLML